MIFQECTQLISSAEKNTFNSLLPGAVDAFYRSNGPYEIFSNASFAYYFHFFFLGFPHWAGGVLLQGEEVCD